MPLDPKVKKLLDIKGFETNPKMDMKTVRELSSAKTEFIKNNYPLLIEKIFNIEDLEISLKERKINVRIYKNNKNNNCPLIMYFHGGGWVHGDLDSSDSLCRSLAVRTNAVIVSVDYRLAPEIPFPGAVWDCYDAMVWAINEKNYLGINPKKYCSIRNFRWRQLSWSSFNVIKRQIIPRNISSNFIVPSYKL